MSAAPDPERHLTAGLSTATQIKQVVVLSLFAHECALNGAGHRRLPVKKIHFGIAGVTLECHSRFRGIVLNIDYLVSYNLKRARRLRCSASGETLILERIDEYPVSSKVSASMHYVLQFLAQCNETRTQEKFLSLFHELTRRLGFNFYRIVRRDAEDLTFTGTVLAEYLPSGWKEMYHAKKYGEIDPVKRTLGLLHQPFRCRDTASFLPQATQRKRAAKLFQDAARFGLREGYAFPVHGRSGLLGGVFILGEGRHLSAQELTAADMAMRAAFWRVLEFAGQSEEILSLPDLSATQLTRRELDVLTLLAQGKTSPEIGKSLSISSHTVDWYINGIQRKFDARNRQHVVAIALRHGIIS